jgi:hypothetical protein
LGMVKIEAFLLKYEIITFLPFVYNAFSSVSNNELLHSGDYRRQFRGGEE